MRRLLHGLWWFVRGVGFNDYRALCKRCGRTGQVHWSATGCQRFERLQP